MNREIKFRVWDKDLKRMRYLNTEHDFICFHSSGQGYYENMQTGPGEWFSDLMQYTGLKDKNGKEIYEGDIVTKCNVPYTVMFDPQGYWCLDGNGALNSEMLSSELSHFEVIGNIYEREENNENI